jgi:hypothetical protein
MRIAAALLALSLFAGCDRPDHEAAQKAERITRSSTRDDIKTETEQRTVEVFSAVELRGAAKLDIHIGGEQSVTLTASKRSLKNIQTRVEGNTLIIEMSKRKGWFSNHVGTKIGITVPELHSLETNGAGEIDIEGLQGGELSLRLAGAYEVDAKGTLDKLRVELSGAGDADLHEVVATNASITVNGAGNVDVHVTEALQAEVNGVGAVHYSGEPQRVSSAVHGLGSISRR